MSSRITIGCLALSCAFLALGLGACSKNAPSQDPMSRVMSFEQFAELNTTDPGKSSGDQPSDCDATCQSRRLELRYVAYIGHQIYCYWDLKKADTGTDFDSFETQLENAITTETSFSQYYVLLRKWASAFHDGHVNVMAKDRSQLEIYSSPVRLETLAPATDHEKVIVSQIAPSPGVNGISVGDEVLAINGVAVADALTNAAADASSGSTERMRRYWAAQRLLDAVGAANGAQPLAVTIKPLGSATRTTVNLPRSVELDLPQPQGADAAAAEDTGEKYISARILPDSIGYLRLDAFEGSQDEALIEAAMDRLSATRGLIIDLRKNGGGDLSGDRIIERLINETVTRYKRSERLNDFILSQRPEDFGLDADSTGQFAIWHDLTVKPNPDEHYGKPVVAMISPYCFSACDTFSASLQDNGLATFIGEPTGGGTGTPLVFDLPSSPLQFRYSVVRGQRPNGAWIEATGTSPDIYIEPTAEDRALDKDTQLDRAVDVLEAKIAQATGRPAPAAPAAIDLRANGIAEIWAQRLDVSPTAAQIDYLAGIAARDER